MGNTISEEHMDWLDRLAFVFMTLGGLHLGLSTMGFDLLGMTVGQLSSALVPVTKAVIGLLAAGDLLGLYGGYGLLAWLRD